MPALSVLTIAGVVAWTALVVIAQLFTPGQSPLSMGLSGLATGRHGWLMKLAFVVRGLAALALVAVVAAGAPAAAVSVLGLALFAVWGGGSALLACYDTDMPGDEPTTHGRAHALIALVAYIAALAGMLLMSLRLRQAPSTADVARWALLLALVAALAMFAQFAGFAEAARDPAHGFGRYAGLLQRVFLALVMLWTVVVAAAL
jgi:hypothetical membrane protein